MDGVSEKGDMLMLLPGVGTRLMVGTEAGRGKQGGGGKGKQVDPQFLREMPTGWVDPWRGVDPVRPPARGRGKGKGKGKGTTFGIYHADLQLRTNIRLVMSAGDRGVAMPPFPTGPDFDEDIPEKPLASAALRPCVACSSEC